MPELPDVQVFKEYLDSTSLHQRIDDVTVAADRILDNVSARTLRSRLRRKSLVSTQRHGKHLFVEIEDDAWLRLHFGMTGKLEYFKGERELREHVRLRLDFVNDYHLAYANTRRLGQIGLVDDIEDFVEEEGLGPDALAGGFDLTAFREVLAGRRGTVKGALMNQSVLAGIGNLYTDEILFQVGLHPEARVNRLSADTVKELYRTMKRVLKQAIEVRADPERLPRSYLLPQRGADGECPRCGRELKKTKVSGRATYYCTHDQRRRR
ncbi:MAG: DNA-formamidopyrimidine glycosylase family protein [Gemmatimonadales bacterium]